jgi:nucleoid-associated protein YgaU
MSRWLMWPILVIPWLGLIPLTLFFRTTRDDLLSYRQSMVNTQMVVTSHSGEIRGIYDKLEEQGRAIQALQEAIAGQLMAQRTPAPAPGVAPVGPPSAPPTASPAAPPAAPPAPPLKAEERWPLPQSEPLSPGRAGGNGTTPPKQAAGPAALDGGGHRVVQGESLWRIAKYEAVYNNPRYWPLLYWKNREQIKDPDLIFPGQELRVPRDVSPSTLREATRAAVSAR